MKTTNATREEMWAKQHLCAGDIDYSEWDRHQALLRQMAKISRSCTFVVDVYKCNYAFASPNFADLLGYDRRKIETLSQQGDYLESRIHPDDLAQLKSMQVNLAGFIYRQPAEDRNNYKNIFTFRLLNAKNQYINVTSKQQVLATSRSGKAWLILGIMDIASCQQPLDSVQCTVLNLKTGSLLSPHNLFGQNPSLTPRETEILQLIKQGRLSKEIAHRLDISIHTVNIHRQNLLRKLGAQNSIEAINIAGDCGIIY